MYALHSIGETFHRILRSCNHWATVQVKIWACPGLVNLQHINPQPQFLLGCDFEWKKPLTIVYIVTNHLLTYKLYRLFRSVNFDGTMESGLLPVFTVHTPLPQPSWTDFLHGRIDGKVKQVLYSNSRDNQTLHKIHVQKTMTSLLPTVCL